MNPVADFIIHISQFNCPPPQTAACSSGPLCGARHYESTTERRTSTKIHRAFGEPARIDPKGAAMCGTQAAELKPVNGAYLKYDLDTLGRGEASVTLLFATHDSDLVPISNRDSVINGGLHQLDCALSKTDQLVNLKTMSIPTI